MTTAGALVTALVIGYLPGAILFRWPSRDRESRAAIAADERLFWMMLTSVTWSTAAAFAMAATVGYAIERLLILNLSLAALALLTFRARLRLPRSATRPGIGLIAPFALVLLCGVRFTPAAEYILGGKDPGVYVNEGIRLARSGELMRHDADVAAVPPPARDLFFPSHKRPDYYGNRFMGIFLDDPDTGAVVPQFPHVFPVSIALGYSIAGIPGATHTVVVWATLGVLAVFFAGARIVGRLPAFFAALLLAVNVAMTWYARYPNAEVVMLALVFGLLLACARAREHGHYFDWTAAALAALLVFLRFDSLIVIACLAGVAALRWIVDAERPSWRFWIPAAAASTAALLYYAGPMKAYFEIYRVNLPAPELAAVAALAGLGLVLLLGRFRPALAAPIRAHLPNVLAVVLLALAAYALFARHPAGRLTDYDAYALRTIRDAYLHWPALILALAGIVLVARPLFWRDPAFVVIVSAFAVFFLYKIRIVPEQFWMARRFLPIILPGMLVLAAGAALGTRAAAERRTVGRTLAGIVVLIAIAWQYAVAAAPVARHVEYRGAGRALERLASHIAADDLVIFESRNSSDVHAFAVPLAYVYDRHVLVLHSEMPDRRVLADFVTQARERYARVLFVASGGTDLLSRHLGAVPRAFEPVRLPEYETTDWMRLPTGPREKDLGYNVYELVGDPPAPGAFAIDVGSLDDPYLLRFHAREMTEDRTFRWTLPVSFVVVPGLSGTERFVTFVMHDGGRPPGTTPASVDVEFNGVPLGRIAVGHGFQSYTLPLPAVAVLRAAAAPDPARLRLVSSVWSPSAVAPGHADTRELGVMIDRIEIH